MSYQPKHSIRIVTAASLFDGHDASINIMRRILQDGGAEVIHLGHNRSVRDIVMTALQEGAQGIAVSSYQGGHMEFFKYMKDLLREYGAPYVKIYGGGGGVIVHAEKKELEDYGIDQIFHPDEGRKMGLEGMIQQVLEGCDFDLLQAAQATPVVSIESILGSVKENTKKQNITDKSTENLNEQKLNALYSQALGVALTAIDSGKKIPEAILDRLKQIDKKRNPLVLGVTGTGGAGKSSLVDELIHRYLNAYPDKKIAVVCVDPTKRKTGGGLLGDRIRMNSLSRAHTYMRSLASRGSGREVSNSLTEILKFLKTLDFDLVIAETSGIGQGSVGITEVSDLSMYVMTSEFGAQSQLEKIDMIDFANFIVINKADRRGSKDALRDVRKQYCRSRKLFNVADEESLPVFLCQASQFNDLGLNSLFFAITDMLAKKEVTQKWQLDSVYKKAMVANSKHPIVPADRQNYLAEIVKTVRDYKKNVNEKTKCFSRLGALELVLQDAPYLNSASELKAALENEVQTLKNKIGHEELKVLQKWHSLQKSYSSSELVYKIRDREIRQSLVTNSLSGLKIKKISLPHFTDLGDRYRYLKLETVPGEFPYTAGVFPLKRAEEEPRRQFAGEGAPERTNRRFHYLSKNDSAKRLSTAFDSVTLYGEDPDLRPDIYGKVGESGVSICTLQDMKKLYDGFDLTSPSTSVSMTINGPAPMILAFYLNTAIDFEVQKKEKELGRILSVNEFQKIKKFTLENVRGTVQADILKEDQAQNTCIFSTDFALKMMGDIQQYFIENQIKNFYSVSISGYHIAEAGANPISQIAFTLSNGFTYVEYYLSRGMKIDDFAGNLSFFFSNGLDPEYSVLGRVARRIWAIAMRDLYKANERSQKLKYHIQTSGRSLHAQEIDFNDIRTTLQALIAIYDHCNSLHTNAYNEAITTPTEESVRRAMAIQMIIQREFGMTKNENPNQGSYFVEELTELVEEAVLNEFLNINERGGVLGAMETQYQRGKIQEESMYYEHLKHSGEYPIIGVNTFINQKTLVAGYEPPQIELARASQAEKKSQLDALQQWQKDHANSAETEIQKLKQAALKGENIFSSLMSAAKVCSLGQMSRALYEVGGEYRRNL